MKWEKITPENPKYGLKVLLYDEDWDYYWIGVRQGDTGNWPTLGPMGGSLYHPAYLEPSHFCEISSPREIE